MKNQMKQRKLLTIILDLTEKCNFSCKYCFEGQFCFDNASTKDTTIDEKFRNNFKNILSLVRQVSKYNGNNSPRILLHGGEPLLITPQAYADFFSMIESAGYFPEYSLQTNASLVQEGHLSLFLKYNVKVGISIDGPCLIHDAQRVYVNGKGTWNEVYTKAIKMRQAGINAGAMATITSNTIKEPDAFYSFFSENHFNLQFNPIFKAEIASEDDSIYITPSQYARFCIKIFDLWTMDDKNIINIYNFTTVAQAFFSSMPFIPTCVYNENCFDGFVTLDVNGDLYHCHRSVGDTSLCSGNIKELTLEDFMKSGEFMSKREEILASSECDGCENFKYCYGGCPYNSYLYRGSFMCKDYFCAAYKSINQHIYNYFKGHEKQRTN